MSLQTRLSDLITAVGTDYKQLRSWMLGAGGSLTGLTTTTKASLLDAINEVNAAASGLAPVAYSGSAADLTGILPASALPPLAITDTFVVASAAAMTGLTAQRGDVAIRTDVNRTFILSAEPASTLANWTQMTAGGDVLSVAGKTGVVTLVKGDVGLSAVDNTSDANKPVSSAQASADNLRLLKTANLSDLNNVATARTNLSVYSQAQLGNPETDLVALYVAAKT